MSRDSTTDPTPPPRRSPTFTTLILIGAAFGLAWGLFLGEHGAWIKWIGDAYIGLLQMTVLPYVAVSLTCNIGRLTVAESGRLARVTFSVLSILWLVGLITLFCMRFSFPRWDGGSFFSTSFLEQPEQVDWVELFVPSNLFWSLSNNLVPAVVVFAIGFGVALIPLTNKDVLLKNLDIVMDGLNRLNKFAVRLSPVGIFAITAHASSTLSLSQFELLQGYLLVYTAAAILLSFWILPALIAACTSLSHREILSESRDMLIAAFVIGNTFVLLPMIVETVERLMQRLATDDNLPTDVEKPAPGYTVQLAYPFPDVGRIVSLVFITFAAWFYGTSVDTTTLLQLTGTGFIGSFGKSVVTIPLLLDLAGIPADIFNLFLAVGVVAGRLGDLMKSMHLLTFSVLTACYMQGLIRINVGRIVSRGLTTLALLTLTVLGIRTYLEQTFQETLSKEKLIVARQLLATPVEATILERSEPNPDPIRPDEDRMDRILRTGVIRIGFDPHELPFCYFNIDRQLVGFDVDMAHQLARDLKVRIEFVPFDSQIIQPLKDDHFDIAMSGLEGTLERATALPNTDAYLEVTRAIVVRDYRRKHFRSLKSVVELSKKEPLRGAYVRGTIQSENLQNDTRGKGLGKATAAAIASGATERIEIVELANVREFFESDPPVADLLMISAEEGFAWTLKYPHYAVVIPEGIAAETPLHYFVGEESRFKEFMKSWLTLKRRNGTVQQLYDYWILGVDPGGKAPRWSVIRDVLGWVE